MSTKSQFRSGYLTYLESGDMLESVQPIAPVTFYDDFLGTAVNKYIANENTTALWYTTETQLNLAIALVQDEVNGVVQMTHDADDIAQVSYLSFNGNECFSMNNGLIWEARLAVHELPTGAGGELCSLLWGISGAYNADPDAVDVNAWFRMEGDANLLWESDDNATNDDDNDTGIDLVADVFHVYRIDCQDISAVKFYVDGALVGTAAMSGLTAATGLVQPVFWGVKTKAVANVSIGSLYIDYIRMWQRRS